MQGLPWDLDLHAYLREVAVRLEELLADDPDADMWMEEMALEAETRTWVHCVSDIRRDNERVFAMDLFADNIIAPDRIRCHNVYLRDSHHYEELADFMDIIL
jgi:hypothetical protein